MAVDNHSYMHYATMQSKFKALSEHKYAGEIAICTDCSNSVIKNVDRRGVFIIIQWLIGFKKCCTALT